MTHFSMVLYPPAPKDTLPMLTSVPPKNILSNKVTLAMALKQAARKLQTSMIERFSFECRKVIGFVFATLHDWLKKFAPIFHPITVLCVFFVIG